MVLKSLFVRFYKSFNYDYLRKLHPNSKKLPWEITKENLWYPHIRVSVESDITTLVGANESGKSHLLSAIEKGLTGKEIGREDFCRYSQFNRVGTGQLMWPDFGFEWSNLEDAEWEQLEEICERELDDFNSFFFFRVDLNQLVLYFKKSDNDYDQLQLDSEKASDLEEMLPQVIRIDAKVPLPDSIPLSWLTSESQGQSLDSFERRERLGVLKKVESLYKSGVFKTPDTVQAKKQEIYNSLSGISNKKTNNSSKELARALLCEVAQIDPEVFVALEDALLEGKEGHANGIIDRVNTQLAKRLNFPKWWAQDKDFQIRVSPRDCELALTIRDRTGTEYSFGERSHGLKYFLSYYVQYRTLEMDREEREILLMDEPDAYLSSQAQQDLLRIFDALANPERVLPKRCGKWSALTMPLWVIVRLSPRREDSHP